MKKILLILTITISSISYLKSVDQKQLEIKPKKHFKDKFTNAKVIAYCEGGKVMYKGSYKNGKKDGEWISYYKGGKIKLKANYKNGRRDGELISYDKNGKIKFKSNYKDGEYIDDNMVSRFSH